MELSEAKKVLKEIWKNTKFEDSRKRIAIEVVLKALDNSISKDEVRKLSNDAFEVNTHEYGTLFVVPYDNIQELLGKE